MEEPAVIAEPESAPPAGEAAEAFDRERRALLAQIAELQAELTAVKQRIEAERELYDEVMRTQESTVAELAAPLIPVADQVLVLPLVGAVDAQRGQHILDVILQGVTERRAHSVIVDISGIPRFHATSAKLLLTMARAVRLLGARLIVTGVTATAARTLIELAVDLAELPTRADLQSGIEYARRLGR